MARSHTKSGPGRTHGQCRLIVDPTNGQHLGVRQPQRRLVPPNFGGNWQGIEYLSQREHDTVTRLTRLGVNDTTREFGVTGHITRTQAIELVKQRRAA